MESRRDKLLLPVWLVSAGQSTSQGALGFVGVQQGKRQQGSWLPFVKTEHLGLRLVTRVIRINRTDADDCSTLTIPFCVPSKGLPLV